MAERREFDILIIYMSDRLGRIVDETPLIITFLNARGIKVISFREGKIRTNTHADKLMTYIRYWQAEGESLKTSARVIDAHEQIVKQGKWRGGVAAYGYKYISRSTLNSKEKPILDIEIDSNEAEIVKIIFRLYNTATRYRCISYTKPKERIGKCHKTLYKASELDEVVLVYTKIFLTTLDKEKLIINYDTDLRKELKKISEQNKETAKEVAQKETEVQKLKDEVIKILVGESQFSQKVISNLIEQREQELIELTNKYEEMDKVVNEIKNQIKLRKIVGEEYKDWAKRFDALTIQEKRAMLFNIIERVTIYPDRIQILFKVRVNLLKNTTFTWQNSLLSKELVKKSTSQTPCTISKA